MWAAEGKASGGAGPMVPGLEMGLYPAVFYFCVPGWAFKQVVNVIQLVGAMEDLASLDDKA